MTDAILEKTGVEDINIGSFLQSTIEAAAQAATANFGQANHIFMSPQMMTSMGWHANPEFIGTSWANKDRLSTRERKFAQLHILRWKLRVLPNDDEFNSDIQTVVIKRLKRAKWARYQRDGKV
jgi:hypothetical protein